MYAVVLIRGSAVTFTIAVTLVMNIRCVSDRTPKPYHMLPYGNAVAVVPTHEYCSCASVSDRDVIILCDQG